MPPAPLLARDAQDAQKADGPRILQRFSGWGNGPPTYAPLAFGNEDRELFLQHASAKPIDLTLLPDCHALASVG